MARYRLTPRAEQDLRDIWRSIASKNESAADSLLLRMFDKLALIEGNYIIIYEPEPEGILAVAVVHGARDPARWL